MTPADGWPVAGVIETVRLVLEPLRVDHAAEMAPLLDDEDLHGYIGGRPATLDQLRERYARQVAGGSADGTQGWLNWIIRERASRAAVGTVQATLYADGGHAVADIAWVVATRYQRRGYAGEAAAGMVEWLRRHGTGFLVAHIHPEHTASIRVAERLGLRATDTVVDGEIRWTT